MAKRRNVLDFLDWIRGLCAAANVEFWLDAKEISETGLRGYFDETGMKLYAATSDSDWVTTLAHELAHMCQFIEKNPLWKDADTTAFDEWLAGKKRLNKVQQLHITRSIQRLELNAERRALGFVKKWGLLENPIPYVREANFTVWKYEIARLTKKWPIYGDDREDIVASMPSRLITQRKVGAPPDIMVLANLRASI